MIAKMHHMDADKMHRENARWELHKNATSNIEHISWKQLPHEATAVRLLTLPYV